MNDEIKDIEKRAGLRAGVRYDTEGKMYQQAVTDVRTLLGIIARSSLPGYQGTYVSVPLPMWTKMIEAAKLTTAADNYDEIEGAKAATAQAFTDDFGAVPYEPDNHHNAAVCPYCSPERQPLSAEAELADALSSLDAATDRYRDALDRVTT